MTENESLTTWIFVDVIFQAGMSYISEFAVFSYSDIKVNLIFLWYENVSWLFFIYYGCNGTHKSVRTDTNWLQNKNINHK